MVFVDSPLLKKEMTIRERNQIFHEIPVDFLATKKSYISISDVLMDKSDEDNLFQWDVCSFISFLEGGEFHVLSNLCDNEGKPRFPDVWFFVRFFLTTELQPLSVRMSVQFL